MNILELFFVAWTVVVLAAIIAFSRWQDRQYPNGQKEHKQLRTHYQRLQAKLVLSSGVIQKGGK